MTHPARFRSIAARALVLAAAASTASCEVDFPHAPFPQQPPGVAAPAYASFLRGHRDTLTVHAIDGDGDPILSVQVDLSDLPPGNDAAFVIDTVWSASGVRCRLLWTATGSDTGFYRVSFTPINALTGPTDTTLLYTVNHAVDHDPVVTCPDTVHVAVGVPQSFSVTASDPDGDPVFELSPTEPLSSSLNHSINRLSWTRTLSGSTASGTLQVRANVAGWFPLRFEAENAAHGFATTMVVAR